MKDDNQFFKDRLNLFESDGWPDLLGELETLAINLNDVRSIESEKDLYFAKGQLSVIQMILNLEDSTKEVMDNQ